MFNRIIDKFTMYRIIIYMKEDSEILEMREIYGKMDTANRKKTLYAATQLLAVQQKIENNKNKAPKRISIAIYLPVGILFISVIIIFWFTIITPALLMVGNAPLLMLQIIGTALGGIFFILAGLARFILHKLSAPLLLLAIGSGFLCIEPGRITDLIGIALIVLIVGIHFLTPSEVRK